MHQKGNVEQVIPFEFFLYCHAPVIHVRAGFPVVRWEILALSWYILQHKRVLFGFGEVGEGAAAGGGVQRAEGRAGG